MEIGKIWGAIGGSDSEACLNGTAAQDAQKHHAQKGETGGPGLRHRRDGQVVNVLQAVEPAHPYVGTAQYILTERLHTP